MSGLTPQQIAEIATKAALAAVAAATGGAPASSNSAAAPETEDDPNEERAAMQSVQANEDKLDFADGLAGQLVPLLMSERHLQVFRWLARGHGVNFARMVQIILRNEISRQMPTYREAQGGGGSSSRDLGTLSERLPPR